MYSEAENQGGLQLEVLLRWTSEHRRYRNLPPINTFTFCEEQEDEMHMKDRDEEETNRFMSNVISFI